VTASQPKKIAKTRQDKGPPRWCSLSFGPRRKNITTAITRNTKQVTPAIRRIRGCHFGVSAIVLQPFKDSAAHHRSGSVARWYPVSPSGRGVASGRMTTPSIWWTSKESIVPAATEQAITIFVESSERDILRGWRSPPVRVIGDRQKEGERKSVRCVKGEYAPRINEILTVEYQLM
jgi:hypothetical protein